MPAQHGLPHAAGRQCLSRHRAHHLAELDRADRLARGNPLRDRPGGAVGDPRDQPHRGARPPVAVQHPGDRGSTAQQVRQQPLELAPVVGADRRECGGAAECLCLGLGLRGRGLGRQILGEGLRGRQRSRRHLFEFALNLVLKLALELRRDGTGNRTGGGPADGGRGERADRLGQCLEERCRPAEDALQSLEELLGLSLRLLLAFLFELVLAVTAPAAEQAACDPGDGPEQAEERLVLFLAFDLPLALLFELVLAVTAPAAEQAACDPGDGPEQAEERLVLFLAFDLPLALLLEFVLPFGLVLGLEFRLEFGLELVLQVRSLTRHGGPPRLARTASAPP